MFLLTVCCGEVNSLGRFLVEVSSALWLGQVLRMEMGMSHPEPFPAGPNSRGDQHPACSGHRTFLDSESLGSLLGVTVG